MSNEIFDRETKLDLLVNVIPLFIMGFFIVGFLVFAPFGIDPLASSIQFGLIAIPFVLLAVLTYFAAVAVAGSENSGPVYLPGQASVSGAEPLEVSDGEGDEGVPQEADAGATELDGDRVASEGDETDADESAESAPDDADEAETDDADEAETDDADEAEGDENDHEIEADDDQTDDDSERNS